MAVVYTTVIQAAESRVTTDCIVATFGYIIQRSIDADLPRHARTQSLTIPLDTKRDISDTLFPANLLPSTEINKSSK